MELHKKDFKSYFFNLALFLALILGILSLYISVQINDKSKELEAAIVVNSQPQSIQNLEKIVHHLEQKLDALEQIGLEREKTLSALSQKYGSLDLKRAEKEGLKPSAPLTNNVEQSRQVVGKSYQIQAGDTLSQIAQRHGVSLSLLIEANQSVDPRRLQIGQSITIPNP